MAKRALHEPIEHRGCWYVWPPDHGCVREGTHPQHLCSCGKWNRNLDPNGAPARHSRHAPR